MGVLTISLPGLNESWQMADSQKRHQRIKGTGYFSTSKSGLLNMTFGFGLNK
jgi:hypothetical protein